MKSTPSRTALSAIRALIWVSIIAAPIHAADPHPTLGADYTVVFDHYAGIPMKSGYILNDLTTFHRVKNFRERAAPLMPAQE
jgi:hypothetical protein